MMDALELIALVGTDKIDTTGLGPLDIVSRLEEARGVIVNALETYEEEAAAARRSFREEALRGELKVVASQQIHRIAKINSLVKQAKGKAESLERELQPVQGKADPALVTEARALLREMDPADRLSAWWTALETGDIVTRIAFIEARPFDPLRLPPDVEREGLETMIAKAKPERVARLRRIRSAIEVVERLAVTITDQIATAAKLTDDERRTAAMV